MTNAAATTVSRRSLLARLLITAVAAPVVGVRLVDPVTAGKKDQKRQSKAERVHKLVHGCAADGGTANIEGRPGGATVTCTGGASGDWTCSVHSKGSRCHKNLTYSPTKPGGGGAVPPSDGAEDPSDGDGTNAGGGAHVPPNGGVDPNGGGSGPVLE
jgi:hypothetical protein